MNPDDRRELELWARILHVAPEVLADLIRQVGPSVNRIRDALKRAEIGRTGGRKGVPG